MLACRNSQHPKRLTHTSASPPATQPYFKKDDPSLADTEKREALPGVTKLLTVFMLTNTAGELFEGALQEDLVVFARVPHTDWWPAYVHTLTTNDQTGVIELVRVRFFTEPETEGDVKYSTKTLRPFDLTAWPQQPTNRLDKGQLWYSKRYTLAAFQQAVREASHSTIPPEGEHRMRWWRGDPELKDEKKQPREVPMGPPIIAATSFAAGKHLRGTDGLLYVATQDLRGGRDSKGVLSGQTVTTVWTLATADGSTPLDALDGSEQNKRLRKSEENLQTVLLGSPAPHHSTPTSQSLTHCRLGKANPQRWMSRRTGLRSRNIVFS